MFDPPAPIALISVDHVVDRIEHLGIGTIANGVDRDLIMVERGATHVIAQHVVREEASARLAGGIAIRFFQPCPARPERAIGIELHAAHAQLVAIEPRRRPRPADADGGVHAHGVAHDAHAQIAGIAHTTIGEPVVHAGPHVGGRGNAVAQQNVLRLQEGEVAILGQRLRHDLFDQRLRRIDEHAVGLQPSLFDAAAGGRHRFGGNAGRLQRRAIAPTGMTIGARQPDRAIADHGIQIGRSRETTETPHLLIPPTANDPLFVGIGRGIGGDARLCLLKRLGRRQVQLERAEAQLHHMAVRVDETGQQDLAMFVGAPVQFDRALLIIGEQLHHLAIGRNQNAGKAHHLAILVERDAVDIVDQRVGKRRRRQRKCGEKKRCTAGEG
ncbi:hypothetical protein D9M73_138310 [compost metagenome]